MKLLNQNHEKRILPQIHTFQIKNLDSIIRLNLMILFKQFKICYLNKNVIGKINLNATKPIQKLKYFKANVHKIKDLEQSSLEDINLDKMNDTYDICKPAHLYQRIFPQIFKNNTNSTQTKGVISNKRKCNADLIPVFK